MDTSSANEEMFGWLSELQLEMIPRTESVLDRQTQFLLDNRFLTIHQDDRDRSNPKDVYTLTCAGLAYALDFFRSKYDEFGISPAIDLVIDYDYETGPSFSNEMRVNLRKKIGEPLKEGERKYYVVHRDGHTSSLVKENIGGCYCFTMVDCYNAYGTKDADHMPVLEAIRDVHGASAYIVTNHDKYQNDYYNCRIFALMAVFELELATQNSNSSSVFDYVNSNQLGRFNGELEDLDKLNKYSEHDVITYGLPPALLQMAQSYSMIRSLAGNELEGLDTERIEGQTFSDNLIEHLTSYNSPRSGSTYRDDMVENIAQEVNNYVYNELTREKTHVERLQSLRQNVTLNVNTQ